MLSGKLWQQRGRWRHLHRMQLGLLLRGIIHPLVSNYATTSLDSLTRDCKPSNRCARPCLRHACCIHIREHYQTQLDAEAANLAATLNTCMQLRQTLQTPPISKRTDLIAPLTENQATSFSHSRSARSASSWVPNPTDPTTPAVPTATPAVRYGAARLSGLRLLKRRHRGVSELLLHPLFLLRLRSLLRACGLHSGLRLHLLPLLPPSSLRSESRVRVNSRCTDVLWGSAGGGGVDGDGDHLISERAVGQAWLVRTYCCWWLRWLASFHSPNVLWRADVIIHSVFW
jgi:hypothetical protein